ncbi:MAG: 4a-hydroxytetrahydrobiopterin dehydratase [Longimicrobiales bacterium]
MPATRTLEKLTAESIKGWLTTHRGWKRQANKLTKDFVFSSFRDSIVFVNRIASVADHFNHHPDIDVRFSKVTVSLTTHDLGGITGKDLDVAEQIDFATSRAE